MLTPAIDTHTRIQKYIFPGGLLPSAAAIVDTTEWQVFERMWELHRARFAAGPGYPYVYHGSPERRGAR